ncbi:MAG: gliding motility-associated C-terminal domain-containing protein [Bacteroidetes bacterium]|nr:gliding motility-associated C-terminal domain-containing protein [Bacteroidota bacterium]
MMKIIHWTGRIIISLSIFLWSLQAHSQLIVQNNLTPQQLVQQILVGSGVTVLNVTYTGAVNARGSFFNGSSTNLGIDEGVILSSGSVFSAPGLHSVFASTNFSQPGDPQLTAIAGSGTHDAAVLEFDFIPQSDTLTFKYVFGSEEYPEYVCSGFNDVFGFFVSGPNPASPFNPYNNMNIALIPESFPPLPVAINTVNRGSPGGGYPASGCVSLAYSHLYIDNQAMGGTTIVYDGFTRTLIATLVVVPCEQYHIKLAVGDAGDWIYDSSVFLEANSFSSPGMSSSISFSNSSSFFGNSVEACNDAKITFELTEPKSSPTYIEIDEILGTATLGDDYSLYPSNDTLVIPAGELSTEIIISPYSDNLIEGIETVKFIFAYDEACAASLDTTTIQILDNTLGVAGIVADSIYCIYDAPDTLVGLPGGGVFAGPGIDSIVFDPAVAGIGVHSIKYSVYFVDQTIFGTDTICQNEVFVDIEVIDGPSAAAGPDDVIAEGMDYTLNGNASYYNVILWTSSGDGTFDDPSILNATYTPSFQDISNGSVMLSLTASAQAPCPGDSTDSMLLTIASGTTAIAGEDATICEGESYQLTGNGLFYQTLEWSSAGDGVFDDPYAQEPLYTPGSADVAAGNVILTLTVYGSSTDSDEMLLTITPAPVADAGGNAVINEGQVFHASAQAFNFSSLTWETSGDGSFDNPGILNATYTPGPDDNLQEGVSLMLIADGLTPCGSDTSVMYLTIESGTASIAGPDQTICANDELLLDGSGSYYLHSLWNTSGDGLFNDPALMDAIYYPGILDIQDSTVTLTLTVFGSDTVSSSLTLYIHPLPEAPVSLFTSEDQFCSGSVTTLELSSSGGSGTELQWFEDICGMSPIGTGTQLNIDAPLQTHTYHVWWQNMCGVSDCREITVNVIENLDVQVGITASKNPIETGETVMFTASPQNGGTNPTYTFMVDGNVVKSGADNTYTTSSLADGQTVSVELHSSENCVISSTAYAEILVGVNFRPKLVAPNAFSPNGDQLNDVFMLKGPVDEIARYTLKIFDRWGARVFETSNIEEGWDGQINGSPAPAGAYIWMADYTIRGSAVTDEGETHKENGTFVLVR